MAVGIDGIRRTNQFIKSSTDDYQDPVFLTFGVNFFPPRSQYPKFDGLSNSALLRNLDDELASTNASISGKIGENQLVEFSALHWLNDYYSSSIEPLRTPALSLAIFQDRLRQVESSPWYFQSIIGIGDLWKAAYRVKEGTKPATLTFNCVDSIEQPLTEMAENYMFAVYDQERLAYRLPDNLRWFDMEITLFEIRDIADYSGQFYQYDGNALSKGLRIIKFNCKMCEFDFSNFLGGAQSEHYIYTQEKPFSPTFDIKVGWVEQEKVNLTEAADYRHMGIFSGALDTLNNRLSRLIQNVTRLPAGIVGSVLNEIQTFVEIKTMGNVYTGANEFLNNLNNIPGDVTGRNPVVGPPVGSNVGEDIYEDVESSKVSNIGNSYPAPTPADEVSDMGDEYPTQPPAPSITDMGDLYEDVDPTQVNDMGDLYEDVPNQEVNEMDDVYEDVPNVEVNEIGETYEPEPGQEVNDIGDIYEDVPPIQVNSMDDVYQDETTPSVSNIGDIYPDEPPAPSVSDMGDLYQTQPTESVDVMPDVYPDQSAAQDPKTMGDAYPIDETTEDPKVIGETYTKEDPVDTKVIGDTYMVDEPTLEADDLGDVYPIDTKTIEVDDLGDVYTEDPETPKVDEIGETYKETQ